MVYCTECGTKNEEDVEYCIKCGANLWVPREKRLERRAKEWGEEFGRRAEEWGEQFGRRAEKECFGLPHGGAIVGLIIGAIIILLGLSLVLGIEIWNYLWAFIIIVIGLLIVAGAIYSFSRRS
ncbi:MAG: zinc ribbon domain-containing protein [Candidatus Bathyarchaeota archaeon]|nr:zinc ribbon domain-containing protein [Candidatus Bathyarchaeota archaeon]MDH5623658.1 zinc ribbon domain-containing protein [Candidatus Bathyarchaeota archaeon]MDH5635275.1 zinc ribbon domain-containing protein [Candidatus Bathyarchaeota archaeon]MDH5701623.1 zinc ribbon domain-containing protein [Candidatus Bathyarchaeota archaeon]